jgi:hypothetical protein
MTFTLPKWGLGSPPWLPKTQSSIARVKKPCLDVFFLPLERSWSVDVENGLALAIRTSVAQVMYERNVGSQTGSRELTQPRCVQVDFNTSLDSSQGDLQVCFKPHPNRRSEQGVMSCQSPRSLNRDNFETPPCESREKVPFGCRCDEVT